MQLAQTKWPARRYVLAIVLGLAAAASKALIDSISFGINFKAYYFDSRVFVLAIFIATSSVSFTLIAEKEYWLRSIAFSLALGLLTVVIAHNTIHNDANAWSLGLAFYASLFAVFTSALVLNAANQTFSFKPRPTTIFYNASSAVLCCCLALLFVGGCFFVAWFILMLLYLTGFWGVIDAIDHDWLFWMFAGLCFGWMFGTLKERPHFIQACLKSMISLLVAITPLLLLGLSLFTLSLLFNGLQLLWDITYLPTPTLLCLIAVALTLVTIIANQNVHDLSNYKFLYLCTTGLSVCSLVLSIAAFCSIQPRLQQYGLTQERIWVCIGIFISFFYAATYTVSILVKPKQWVSKLRNTSVVVTLVVNCLIVFLALPIVKFDAISANNQLARINDGLTKKENIDYIAFTYKFGDEGRAALRKLTLVNDQDIASTARLALDSDKPWKLKKIIAQSKNSLHIENKLQIYPASIDIPKTLKEAIIKVNGCLDEYCLLILLEGARTASLIDSKCDTINPNQQNESYPICPPKVIDFYRSNGSWALKDPFGPSRNHATNTHSMYKQLKAKRVHVEAVKNGNIEVLAVAQQQLYIDDKAIGGSFSPSLISSQNSISNTSNIHNDEPAVFSKLKNVSSANPNISEKLRIYPAFREIPESLIDEVARANGCDYEYCLLIWPIGSQIARLINPYCERIDASLIHESYFYCPPNVVEFYQNYNAWNRKPRINDMHNMREEAAKKRDRMAHIQAVENNRVKLISTEKRQLYIGGQPIGNTF